MSGRASRERSDASLRTIGITAASLAALIGLGLLVAWPMALRASRDRAAALGAAGLFQHGAEARTGIATAWIGVEARTREHLATYGWIDRKQGVARIPIEQAMRRMAEKGGWNP